MQLENKMQKIIVIAGATATGKSDVALELAEKLDAPIISADSMQIYKYMNIGTAKVDPETRKKIKHYMIDEADPSESFSVADYKSRVKKHLHEIYNLGKIPILCGGTGFYINAVLKDTDFIKPKKKDFLLRKKLSELDINDLKKKLYEIDEEVFYLIEENNKRKLIRALEFFYETGKKISEHNKIQRRKKYVYDVLFFILNLNREALYKKIDLRVDKMIEAGLIDEVKTLAKKYSRDLISMQGIGYKEIILYLEDKVNLSEAIDLIKKNTRHYAKRQITWFKHQADGIWIDRDNFKNQQELVDYIFKMCKDKFMII